jgi:3-deoxy-manno-octulosonate cytidylyltransferase (CMP-KDO synthetase)
MRERNLAAGTPRHSQHGNNDPIGTLRPILNSKFARQIGQTPYVGTAALGCPAERGSTVSAATETLIFVVIGTQSPTMTRKSMKAIAVIPARLASTRLPRKMLREIAGKALIGVVYEAVRSSPLLADVIIATDSEQIMQVCRERGWKAQMTSPAHRSGTERVHEVSGREAADVYINVQGDEPLTRPEHIATLLQVMQNPDAQVGTLMTPAAQVDIPNPNAVKVVIDLNGRALYFSRATIPFDRDGTRPPYFKHLGLYAYRKNALDRFVQSPESPLEKSERLEQLRFLENGISIFAGETPHDSVGVDTEEDLQRVIEILGKR